MELMPDSAFSSRLNIFSATPKGVTRPIPVTTTRFDVASLLPVHTQRVPEGGPKGGPEIAWADQTRAQTFSITLQSAGRDDEIDGVLHGQNLSAVIWNLAANSSSKTP